MVVLALEIKPSWTTLTLTSQASLLVSCISESPSCILSESPVYISYRRDDIVPIFFPRFLGFHHVEGEVHILNDLSWVSCPGEDSTDANCSIGYVPNIFSGDLNDHGGPYDGVAMGCAS